MELRLIARTDFLTGALTRRAFIAELDRAWARFARQNEPAAVLLLDIDHFKTINDTLGHATGDRVLAAVAGCCSENIRAGDAFGRIGGEEFAILLANATADEALRTAERFRSAIASLEIAESPAVQVTASIGVASLTTEVSSMDDWLARADAAMYEAKRGGRNRCCVAAAGSERHREQV
jgi:diguanylate cyclase (GGDEF)-like protein